MSISLQYSKEHDFGDIRILPRCGWGLRSSGMFPSVCWQLVTDISGRLLGPIFKGQAVEDLGWVQWPSKVDCLIHENGTEKPSRNVSNYQLTVRNTPKERKHRALLCLKVSMLNPLILILRLFLRWLVGETPSPCQFVTLILTGIGPRSKYTNRISTS